MCASRTSAVGMSHAPTLTSGREEAHERRQRETPSGNAPFRHGLIADLLRLEGARLNLPPHEMNVLLFLLDRPGRALPRAQIAERTLSLGDDAPKARTVDSHVARIRKKLGAAAGAHIQTVWRIGYRFDP